MKTPTQTLLASIRLRGVTVDLDWTPCSGALGIASHTVSTAAMSEGPTDGPTDGETLSIAGREYRLGQHEYETDDDTGETTCSAHIYPCDIAEKIDWKTSLPVLGQGVPAMTHAANDGVVTYYCRAPGLTMRQVATEFLRNYDRNGNEDGEPISFEISALDAEQQPVNWVAYSGQSGEEAQKS